MMPQATLTAQRILEMGGNAFDAAVGGQAVLGLVSPAANGVAATRCNTSLRRVAAKWKIGYK
jgi:hypothetical protein